MKMALSKQLSSKEPQTSVSTYTTIKYKQLNTKLLEISHHIQDLAIKLMDNFFR